MLSSKVRESSGAEWRHVGTVVHGGWDEQRGPRAAVRISKSGDRHSFTCCLYKPRERRLQTILHLPQSKVGSFSVLLHYAAGCLEMVGSVSTEALKKFYAMLPSGMCPPNLEFLDEEQTKELIEAHPGGGKSFAKIGDAVKGGNR